MSFRFRAALAAYLCLMTGLRLYGLSTRPFGLDIDESMILSWGRRALEEGQFYAYAPEWTRWEMLPGYLYAGIMKVTGIEWVRLAPALIGMAEILLVARVAARLFRSEQAGWLAAVFVAASPWHFYYSRIVGTCVGVAALMLGAHWVQSQGEKSGGRGRFAAQVALLATGLLYYTVYRIYFVKWVLESAIRRSRRGLLAAAAALGVCFVGIAASHSELSEFLSRGGYNFSRVKADFLTNYGASLILPFAPLASRFEHTTPQFMADYVHTGLASILGGGSPLSWGISILTVMGLGMAVVSVAKRRPEPLSGLLLLLGFAWVFLGYLGPSLSRFLFTVPFLALFAVRASLELSRRLPKAGWNAVLAISLVGGFVDCAAILRALGDRDRTEVVFQGRFRDIDGWLARRSVGRQISGEDPVYLFTDHGYFSARLLDETGHRFKAFLPLEPEQALNLVRYSHPAGTRKWVVFDEVPARAEEISGHDKRARLAAIERAVRDSGTVLDEGEIIEGGRMLGRYFQVN